MRTSYDWNRVTPKKLCGLKFSKNINKLHTLSSPYNVQTDEGIVVTTRQAQQTQPALLAADSFAADETEPILLAADAFAAALEAILGEDRWRTLSTSWTIMLRRTSKRVKEVVDKMWLPAVVRSAA
jgi:hypothetical protein